MRDPRQLARHLNKITNELAQGLLIAIVLLFVFQRWLVFPAWQVSRLFGEPTATLPGAELVAVPTSIAALPSRRSPSSEGDPDEQTRRRLASPAGDARGP